MLLIVFFAAFLGTVLSVLWWKMFGPNNEVIIPSYGVDKPIFYEGKPAKGEAKGEGESLLIPLSVLQELVDPNIIFEKETNSVILTTDRNVVRLQSDQLNAWVNEKPFQLRFPITEEAGVVYVPIEPLERFYGVKFEEAPDTGIVTLRKPGNIINWASVPLSEKEPERTVPVRQEAFVRSPIVGEVPAGERVAIWGEENGWHLVQLSNGRVGYAEEKSLQFAGSETVKAAASEEEKGDYVPKRPMGQKIVLAWEQVYGKTPDPSNFGPMAGLNVVSPTWFHLLDGTGALANGGADASYVRWAHDRGYQVWALFSNSFDPKLTEQALSSYDRRMNMARQLVTWSEIYGLDGINIDFENVRLEDGPRLTQFVRELTPLLHEAGVTVSIDVTLVSSSENWSKFYDRKALAKIVDYMMLMAYDEHWATSPDAGSVASLPWVEHGVRQLLEEYDVRPEKLILGVPFYTRIWTEETVDGKVKVSSKAVGMDVVQNIIAEKKLTPKLSSETGQHYVEYQENGKVKKIWMEDETSMKSRVDIALKYRLAGVAAWSRSFGKESVWDAIHKTLQSSYK